MSSCRGWGDLCEGEPGAPPLSLSMKLIDELIVNRELSDEDMDEIAAKINDSARQRFEEESE
ncbi:hypothetical protein halTADL_1393 [Halohasta litchfieldiae]|uniref:Uncharacterized protein n=1 Tax=Halohasta litchfieldiae TaxID=1073996 RepID=A0A1H6WBD9_9EURY|nr:hypothetical protein halTADL_1393 [Halohasta litchfieldiae]SEJ10140.1 hypothetical protein SAMN05444271_12122 [Halohasta litchfieldiae]